MAVMSPVDDPRNADYGTGAMSSGLTDLARWTGGDIFIAIAPAHTSIAARQIVGEMRHQYMLAFEASSRIGWRPLEVKAKDREHVVRARSGYTAGGGSTPSADTVQRDKVRQDEQTDDDERRRAISRTRSKARDRDLERGATRTRGTARIWRSPKL